MLASLYSHLRNQWIGTLALFAVLAGGGAYAAFDPVGGDGDIDACFHKKSGDLDIRKGKKCGKREKRVSWGQIGPRGAPGPQGEPGTPGAQGADATNLFAYVRETFPGADATDATIEYGKGVTGLDDPGGNGAYIVTFDRSLANCVVHAVAGKGAPDPDPASSAAFLDVVPLVTIHPSGAGTVRVSFFADNVGAGNEQDTSFMISAFC
jgi:hypothetical protein